MSFKPVHEVLMASILWWFTTPSPTWSCFVRTLCYDPSILGGPAWMEWLIVSLSYRSPFASIRQWSMKRNTASEDEMAVLHHQCNRHELGQTSVAEEGQGSLACCSPWSCKGWSTTGWLNNNNTHTLQWQLWNMKDIFINLNVVVISQCICMNCTC